MINSPKPAKFMAALHVSRAAKVMNWPLLGATSKSHLFEGPSEFHTWNTENLGGIVLKKDSVVLPVAGQ